MVVVVVVVPGRQVRAVHEKTLASGPHYPQCYNEPVERELQYRK